MFSWWCHRSKFDNNMFFDVFSTRRTIQSFPLSLLDLEIFHFSISSLFSHSILSTIAALSLSLSLLIIFACNHQHTTIHSIFDQQMSCMHVFMSMSVVWHDDNMQERGGWGYKINIIIFSSLHQHTSPSWHRHTLSQLFRHLIMHHTYSNMTVTPSSTHNTYTAASIAYIFICCSSPVFFCCTHLSSCTHTHTCIHISSPSLLMTCTHLHPSSLIDTTSLLLSLIQLE